MPISHEDTNTYFFMCELVKLKPVSPDFGLT